MRAKDSLTLATQIAPGEPASWADLGILAVRQQELDLAYDDFEKARSLAPKDSRIEQLLGDVESRRGKLPEAIQHLKRAVEFDGKNAKALYLLAEQTERQGSDTSDGEALKLFRKVLTLYPKNTEALLEVARLAGKTGKTDVLKDAVSRLQQQSSEWPPAAKDQMAKLGQAAGGPNPRAAALQVAFLRNVLAQVPEFRRTSQVVKTPAVFVGEPFLQFVKLPSPAADMGAPDAGIRFAEQPLEGVAANAVWVRAVWLDDSGKSSILWADASSVHTSDGAAVAIPGGGQADVALADLNYDFKTDLVIAGQGGLALYQQETPQHFTDVTGRSHIPGEIVHGSYTGAWPLDVDLDGDLDIILGADGADPLVLRNNSDGTYAIAHLFAGAKSVVSFATADIDRDGDPDVAMVGADGKLTVFSNERFGRFQRRTTPAAVAQGVAAVTAGDVNGDGVPDFVVLKMDGKIIRLSDVGGGQSWNTEELATASAVNAKTASISLADFDNNGGLDLLTGSGEIFLHGPQGFSKLTMDHLITSATSADRNGDGRLDLLGLSAGKPVLLMNRGLKNYRWQLIRTRAAAAHGDQRINSFGLGGEMEIRAGLLTQKQVMTSPVLHFGLADHDGVDLARITWPNGLVQAEFELGSNQSILATQRLKGSCPSLFAWDGQAMRFIKDGAPWSPALGLHINAQTVANIDRTEEWFKIPRDQVAIRDGYYDLRITAELWETFYIDHYALLAVDHPKDTEVFSDERFSVPPPPLKVYATAPPQPFSKAVDDQNKDVSGIIREKDGKYLDTFGRGRYQGVTRDHWVELELPDHAPRTGRLYLIAEGWTHPTDATVNIALGQNSDPAPQGLRIEVPNATGQWVVAQSGMGFLAGKLKTAVFDISHIFLPGAPRKLRLGANMEIFWDQLTWAAGAPSDGMRTQQLPMSAADLRPRGFSVMEAANTSSPETPIYDRLAGTAPRWSDLEGYYTRFGDVRELLGSVDGRYVIMNAGDEIRLRFAPKEAPPNGWVRDLIMIGNGWIKDGDYNSVFSQTVLPLPYHGMKDYSVPPGRLQNDPAYRLHPGDWQTFQTRYITPDTFRNALWNKQ